MEKKIVKQKKKLTYMWVGYASALSIEKVKPYEFIYKVLLTRD